jgi:hypothetical protein
MLQTFFSNHQELDITAFIRASANQTISRALLKLYIFMYDFYWLPDIGSVVVWIPQVSGRLSLKIAKYTVFCGVARL